MLGSLFATAEDFAEWLASQPKSFQRKVAEESWDKRQARKKLTGKAYEQVVTVKAKVVLVETRRGVVRTHPCVMAVPCAICKTKKGYACLGANRQPHGVAHTSRRSDYQRLLKHDNLAPPGQGQKPS